MIKNLFHNLVYAGVDVDTPEFLTNRILLTNIVCVIGIGLAGAMCFINYAKGYYFLLGVDVFYLVALCTCLFLNSRRHCLASRLVLAHVPFLGMVFTCLFQGKAAEIEHFLLPFSIVGFCIFTPRERIFSFLFMTLCLVSYFFLMLHDGPLIPGHLVHFTAGDREINRVSYLALLGASLYALCSAFDRAMRIIAEQKTKLFEERRMALIGSMACNVAHEINSPLAALDLHLYQLENLMKDKSLSAAEVERRVQKMLGISGRISTIVHELKFLTRPEVARGENLERDFGAQ